LNVTVGCSFKVLLLLLLGHQGQLHVKVKVICNQQVSGSGFMNIIFEYRQHTDN